MILGTATRWNFHGMLNYIKKKYGKGIKLKFTGNYEEDVQINTRHYVYPCCQKGICEISKKRPGYSIWTFRECWKGCWTKINNVLNIFQGGFFSSILSIDCYGIKILVQEQLEVSIWNWKKFIQYLYWIQSKSTLRSLYGT